MVLILLQWNARSLISNGLEFKKYIDKLEEKPDVICIQETSRAWNQRGVSGI